MGDGAVQNRRMENARTMALMPFEETPLENTNTAPQHSWLASLVAFIAWLFDAIAKLKRVKRTTKFKANWRDHFDGLRETEWHVAQMLAQGVALLLSGKTLDDADYISTPMPADFGGPCPRTPYAMNLRFLKVAQFMRDPEKYIRRHAARIAKRAGIDLSNPLAAHGSTDAALRAAAHHEPVGAAGIRRHSGNTRKQFALMVSSAHRARLSNREGALRCQLIAQPRAPPTQPYSPLPMPSALRAPENASARLATKLARCVLDTLHRHREHAMPADDLADQVGRT
jgi:hypothetical protein